MYLIGILKFFPYLRICYTFDYKNCLFWGGRELPTPKNIFGSNFLRYIFFVYSQNQEKSCQSKKILIQKIFGRFQWKKIIFFKKKFFMPIF